ncbi:MAG: sugar phosphate isomerase/epimerase [Spirochaetales bacterium]|nr:sugar phosphate isomerase/epimerase [Spirochaetales bacterium]
MLIPGIVSITFKTLSIQEIISLTNANDLKAIEWSENHHIELNNKAQAALVGELTRDNGLQVASYGSYFKLGKRADIIPHLENTKAMKAPFMRIWAYDKPSSEVDGNEYNVIVAEAKKVCKIAKDYNIPLTLEWHKNTLTDTNESGLKLLRDVDSPYFKTFWQPTQALSVEQRVEGLKLIKPYLTNLHVYYWTKDRREELKDGKDYWQQYLKAVDDKVHYALLEFVKNDSAEQFEKDVIVLKHLLNK